MKKLFIGVLLLTSLSSFAVSLDGYHAATLTDCAQARLNSNAEICADYGNRFGSYPIIATQENANALCRSMVGPESIANFEKGTVVGLNGTKVIDEVKETSLRNTALIKEGVISSNQRATIIKKLNCN